MLVTFPDTLSVSEYFELARYGQVILNEGGRPRTFTDANSPSAAGLIDHEIDLASRTIILDDTDNRQNRPVDTPNTSLLPPRARPEHQQLLPRRRHDHQPDRRAALVVRRPNRHRRLAHPPGDRSVQLRLHPSQHPPGRAHGRRHAEGGQLQRAQLLPHHRHDLVEHHRPLRPSPPSTAAAPTAPRNWPASAQRCCRALQASTRTCFGLMEMENTPGVEPLADHRCRPAGTYAYIDTGVIGTDAIQVGLIYKTATVPLSELAHARQQRRPALHRYPQPPALAQTFEEMPPVGASRSWSTTSRSKGSLRRRRRPTPMRSGRATATDPHAGRPGPG